MIKRKVGYPPKYATPDELKEKVQEYIDSCIIYENYNKEIYYDANGDEQSKMVHSPKLVNKPSITGLQIHLGFSSDSTMSAYAKKSDEFNVIIEDARQFVRKFYEDNLSTKYSSGSKFILSAMWGLSEKTEVVTKTVEYDVDFSSLED